jgi:hypothetical protein
MKYIGIFFIFCLFSCTSTTSSNPTVQLPNSDTLESDSTQIVRLSKTILRIIKENNDTMIAEFVSDSFGLRYSSIIHIQETDIKFSKRAIKPMMLSPFTHRWGYGDPSGEMIELNYNEYKKQFILNHPYWNSQCIVAKTPVHFNLSNQNIEAFYGPCLLADFTYLDSSVADKNVYTSNWGSLIFVFKKLENKWYLCGIVNNHYTP